VKSDINREIELAELKKLQTSVQDAARDIEQSVKDGMSEAEKRLKEAKGEIKAAGDELRKASRSSRRASSAAHGYCDRCRKQRCLRRRLPCNGSRIRSARRSAQSRHGCRTAQRDCSRRSERSRLVMHRKSPHRSWSWGSIPTPPMGPQTKLSPGGRLELRRSPAPP
jgi:hypothetical protein